MSCFLLSVFWRLYTCLLYTSQSKKLVFSEIYMNDVPEAVMDRLALEGAMTVSYTHLPHKRRVKSANVHLRAAMTAVQAEISSTWREYSCKEASYFL